MNKNFKVCFSIIPFLLLAVFVTRSHAQIIQSNNMALTDSHIMPMESSTITRTAIVALRRISQARLDIYHKALPKAQRDLAEAVRLMDTIRDELSTSTVKNLIEIARTHLEYEKAEQVLHDLPPIYSSLDTISVYIPTEKARWYIDRAKGYLEKNDKRGAERELALAGNSLIVIEVELPLLKMQQYIAKAQGYLTAKNGKKADEVLRVAELRAMDLYTGINSPILQANKNLWLTYRNFSTATPADTKVQLSQAREYLSTAAAGGGVRGKKEVTELSAELGELEKRLASDGKVAEFEIKAVWEKSKALADRSTDYLSAGLSKEETTLNIQSDLIEAKLHVAYAETYQVTTSEPEKAIKELDTAYAYLLKASENDLAGPAARKKILGIGSSLMALKANPEKRDAAVRERYDTLKEELNSLIQKM